MTSSPVEAPAHAQRPLPDDPEAEALFAIARAYNRAQARGGCRKTLDGFAEAVARFKGRIQAATDDPTAFVVVIVSTDSAFGHRLLSEVLMPKRDWTTPLSMKQFGWGKVPRDLILLALDTYDTDAATCLRAMTTKVAAVVIDYGTAAVFEA